MVEIAAPDRVYDCCPECGGDVHTTGVETVCADCGLVLEEQRIDHGVESAFREKQRGAPRTVRRHDRGLGAAPLGNHDVRGENVYSPRLKRWQIQDRRAKVPTKADRNLVHAVTEVRRVAAALGQPRTVIDQACRIVRRAQDEDLLRGRSIEAVATASVLAAARIEGAPVTLTDAVAYSRVGEDGVRNAYRVLNQELGLPTPPPTVASHVPRIASAIDLPDEFRAKAENVARQVDESGLLSGRNPSSSAAACIYAVTRGKGIDVPGCTQKALADQGGTTPVPIRDAVRTMQASDDVDLEGR